MGTKKVNSFLELLGFSTAVLSRDAILHCKTMDAGLWLGWFLLVLILPIPEGWPG